MGKSSDYVPVRLTRAYRDAQENEFFLGWLKMQEAVMNIEFPYFDLPEVKDHMFTGDSLRIVENKLLDLYSDPRVAFAGEENLHRTMRYVYYIGETYRRAFEGTWVVLPEVETKGKKRAGDSEPAMTPAVDLPFNELFTNPMQQISMALSRRTGTEITAIFQFAAEDYAQWVQDGRPERVFRGTLREDDA